MPVDWSNYRLDGCVLERTPVRAPEIKPDNKSLPTRVDLRKWCAPVENQGAIGACAANAVVAALEYLQRRDEMKVVDLSRLFVYYNARFLGECTDIDSGTCLSHVLAGVLAHGACEDSAWPAKPENVTAKPPEQCYENALRHQAIEFAMTPLGQPALIALARGLPVAFTTFMPRAFYDTAATTGETPLPSASARSEDVGHCMLLVGYDLDRQHWIARNSWGEGWGEGGYVRIPFLTLKAYAVPEHFWVIGAISQRTGLSIVGPSIAQATALITANAPEQMRARLAALRLSLRSDISTRLEESRRGFRNRLRGD